MIKNFFHNKGVGFYVSLATGVIALITAIIYAVVYGSYRANNNEPVISWLAFVLLLLPLVLTVVGGFTKMEKYAPYGVFACGLVALVCYIYRIYYHASVVFANIEEQDMRTTLFFVAGLMIFVFVMTIVSFFLPQTRGEQLEKEAE